MQEFARGSARLWPTETYFQVRNEPNLNIFWAGMDPHAYAASLKAVALGVWYENPNAVIVLSGITSVTTPDSTLEAWFGPHGSVQGGVYLRALYEAGIQRWFDIAAIHYADSEDLDRFREIMAEYGDANKQLWVTEVGKAVNWSHTDGFEAQAEYLVEHLRLYDARDDVHGVIIFELGGHDPSTSSEGCLDGGGNDYCILEPMSSTGEIVPRPAYWAVREFLTGQPRPNE